MSEDISFARYYRPSTLDGYVGNSKVKDTVKRIMRGKKPQSILLTGNTGCGKTTLARILESWYICENPSEDGSPCGVCSTCLNMRSYIETGDSEMLPDIREIDVTDKSGKSDMDSLLETLDYPAFGGGWKVYLFDECHAMSSAASTRLLKVLEEPPEKVLLIFCTTNPEKMLDTVRNRCQLQLKITKPTTVELSGLLKGVCMDRGKSYDMQGLRMLCSRSDHVIRNALNYLEQVINSRGSATGEAVSTEFQEVSDALIYEFYNAYINKNYVEYINILYKIKVSYDFGLFLNALTTFTTRGIYIVNSVNVEGLSDAEIKSYHKVFSSFSIDDIAYILSSLKKMSYGDIEANLMAFMYNENENSVVKEVMPEKDKKVTSVINESKMRNSNLQALEDAKLKKGVESAKSSMESVKVEDALEFFNLEKISM